MGGAKMSSEVLQVEDALSRAEQRASPLYAGRVEVYAKASRARFRTIKWAALRRAARRSTTWHPGCAGIAAPGAPDQAVLVDIDGGRLYFFGIEIWPQEVYYLTGILILAAFGLFLATALFGRVWCGFACPQTVWTDLFMLVERWIEGDRNAAHALRQGAVDARQDGASASPSTRAWLLIALLTGGAWIMYFHDAPTVVGEFFTGQAGLTVYFFVGLFTATTYLLAGLAREQVCTYMCPWPRIQGALVDEDTHGGHLCSAGAASRAASTRRARAGRAAATASTASSASPSARRASTSATASSSNASAAACASTPATR